MIVKLISVGLALLVDLVAAPVLMIAICLGVTWGFHRLFCWLVS